MINNTIKTYENLVHVNQKERKQFFFRHSPLSWLHHIARSHMHLEPCTMNISEA